MKSIEAVRYKDRLDHLFSETSKLPADMELRSHFAKYLCVLVSGFLEIAIRAIYSDYAKEKAAPDIANFVESRLDDFQNPKMVKILDLAGAFNNDWAETLRKATEGDLKDAVDSIVADRNNIAHGESAGITLVRVRDYYAKAVKVVELVEELCLP